MTLTELKAKATELGLTPDEVRQHGNLSYKATWEAAIAEFEQWKEAVDTHCEQMGIPQWSYPEDETTETAVNEPNDIAVTVNQIEELPFEPTHTLVNGEWVKIEDEPLTQNDITPVKSFPIVPFTFEATKPCKPDNSGYLVWDEKLRNWVKEKPSDSSTPYRDKLLAKMMGYVGKGISLNDLEEMQKESPDEATAAIYLGWLEESEAILKEALAA